MSGKTAFVFPGQGSQFVGMGKDLWNESAVARQVLEQADDTLGFSLTALCFEGAEEELRQTQNAQPAILAVSAACLAVLRDVAGVDTAGSYVAGHSLGEFTALVAAGSLSYPDALRLVRTRGELMAAAGRERPGTMAAVLGLDDQAVEKACAEASEVGIVRVANYNSPGQAVISGEPAAVERAGEVAKAMGARRIVPLSVSGAFHSPLLSSAVGPFGEAVARVTINQPNAIVISNITAGPLTTDDAIRDELPRQIMMPVRWSDSVAYMVSQGVSNLVEVGPGRVLTGMVKRNPNLRTFNIDSVKSAQEYAAAREAEL